MQRPKLYNDYRKESITSSLGEMAKKFMQNTKHRRKGEKTGILPVKKYQQESEKAINWKEMFVKHLTKDLYPKYLKNLNSIRQQAK